MNNSIGRDKLIMIRCIKTHTHCPYIDPGQTLYGVGKVSHGHRGLQDQPSFTLTGLVRECPYQGQNDPWSFWPVVAHTGPVQACPLGDNKLVVVVEPGPVMSISQWSEVASTSAPGSYREFH